MTAESTPSFRLPDPALETRIARALATWMGVSEGPERTGHVTYWDTFDWRIHDAGGTYETRKEGEGTSHVWRGPGGEVLHRFRGPVRPGFASDLPPGPLRDALDEVLEVRKLLPVVVVRSRSRTLDVLDGERKTVARIRFEQATAGPPGGAPAADLPRVARVLPVRGYDAAAARVEALLEREFRLAREEAGGFLAAARAIGRDPGGYSSRFRLALDPEEPAGRAVRRIHAALLDTMLANEDGVRGAVDTEFLHDFRVAVRRTRSALGQIRDVLPPETVLRMKEELAAIGAATGPLRDLDVYLVKMEDYRRSLPEEVRDDLDPLRGFLRAEQRRAHEALVAFLDGERYESLVRDWRAFLEAEPGEEDAPDAGAPIREVAAKQIWRVYPKILAKGGKLGRRSPAAKLHDLRIRCKKLRYLLEFFRSLCDEEPVARAIRDLKKLQDNLGDFNDYEVQQERLAVYADRMAREGLAPTATVMAMGRLIERLARGQAKERKRFAGRFARFASAENQGLFRELFPPPEPPRPEGPEEGAG